MNPQVKTGLTHTGTFLGGLLAAGTFLATKHVDLYAIWDQVNAVIAAITTLVATVTPLLTTAYGIYRTTTKVRLAEVVQDPAVKAVITTSSMANTGTLAAEPKVVSSVMALPPEVKNG